MTDNSIFQLLEKKTNATEPGAKNNVYVKVQLESDPLQFTIKDTTNAESHKLPLPTVK